MKKGIRILMVMITIFAIIALSTIPALAAPREGVNATDLQPFELAMLGTLGGVAIAVAALVQATKFLVPLYFPKAASVNPLIYCGVWSLILMAARLLWVVPPTGPQDYFTAAINLLIVAATATGGFEFVIKPIQKAVAKRKNISPGTSADAQ